MAHSASPASCTSVFRTVVPACVVSTLAFAFTTIASADDLQIPAFTAYMLPDSGSARISEQRGVTRWNDPKQSVNWYGKFSQSGSLTASFELRLPADSVSKLKLNIDGQSLHAIGTGEGDDAVVVAKFGEFKIAEPGHYRISLESLNESGNSF